MTKKSQKISSLGEKCAWQRSGGEEKNRKQRRSERKESYRWAISETWQRSEMWRLGKPRRKMRRSSKIESETFKRSSEEAADEI